MSSLRSSAHYVWNTSFILGTGATGAVYQGMHRSTGESVAVKTFNHRRSRPVNDLQMREFEVLKKLNHDNIVKLLAVEEETETHKKVLVMELCNGGSLYTILDDPQNSYGLDEAEFLNVLRDLSAGMKYLRDNSMVHRDLKPGNIMKYITEDKKSVYKLIDFGAARELEEDQQFLSLYGTEEYLHPDLYERAVLKRPARKAFRATVDLWSIGVTLYHVATGSLPFRPYGGRINTETMHFIITKKASGIISGVQHSEKGPIEWSRELPKTCLLNQGLRDLVTTLLAGILEGNDSKMWSFDDYFSSVTDIVSRKAINVFYLNEGREICLYMQPCHVLRDVKDQIAAQLKVPQGNQMLLFDKSIFENTIDPSSKVSSYPETSCMQPLILLHNENTVVKDLTRFGAPSNCFPKFDNIAVDDAALAKTCCSVAHAVKRLVGKLVRCRELLLSTTKLLLNLIFENVTKLCSNLDVLTQQVEDLDQRFNRLEKSSLVVAEFLNCWPSEHQCESDQWKMTQLVFEKKRLKDEINTDFLSLQTAVSNLKETVLVSGLLQKEWDQAIIDCPELTGCVEKADTYVNKMLESWKHLVKNKNMRDRNGRNLSYCDQQFHILEKVKIEQTSEKLLALVQERCLESCRQAFCSLYDWYSDIQATMGQCKRVDEVMVSVAAKTKSCAVAIYEAELKADEIQHGIISQLKICKSVNESSGKEPVSKLNIQNGETVPTSHKSRASLIHKMNSLMQSHSGLRELISESDSLIDRLFQENQRLENSIGVTFEK